MNLRQAAAVACALFLLFYYRKTTQRHNLLQQVLKELVELKAVVVASTHAQKEMGNQLVCQFRDFKETLSLSLKNDAHSSGSVREVQIMPAVMARSHSPLLPPERCETGSFPEQDPFSVSGESFRSSSKTSTAPVKDFLAQHQLLGQVKHKLLRRVKPFADLPAGFFDLVAENLSHVTVPAGIAIVTQGEYGESMYFVASGTVSVEMNNKRVTKIGEGSYFGELALLDGGLRNASCIALVECQLFSLSRDVFLLAMHEFPAARTAMEREKIVRVVEGDYSEEERRMPEIRQHIQEAIETRLRELSLKLSSKLQFKLQNKIGKGACGSVFSAINTSNGKPLAVKQILNNGLNQRAKLAIEQESDLMRTLSHPNVVQGYGIQIDEEAIYILMELLPMGSLARLSANGGPMPEATVQAYTRQILSGLHYLHSRGVLHRDLKPANILISESGTVKLADLGICKIGAVAAEHQSNTLVGTPAYLSPDAIDGRYSIGSDLWALGCTVLELITAIPPFSEKQFDIPTQLLFYIANHHAKPEIPPVPVISQDLCDFFSKIFADDPRERGDCAELLQHPWICASSLSVETMCSNPSNLSVAGCGTTSQGASITLYNQSMDTHSS